MDKIFDVEIDGQVTLPDGSTLGPLEETTVNVVQPSEGGGGAMVVTFDITLDDEILIVSNASMTPSEVVEAMKTNTVVGVMNMNAGPLQGKDVCGCAVISGSNQHPAFRASYVDVETGEIVYVITSNATSEIEYWVFNAEAYFG